VKLNLVFCKTTQARLVQSTQSLGRLNIDFKDPVPSIAQNHYIVVIVNEYYRFPIPHPCVDGRSKAVITCFKVVYLAYPVFPLLCIATMLNALCQDKFSNSRRHID